MKETIEYIADIEKMITEANEAYYNSGTTIISDAEYDGLKEELRKLNPDSRLLQQIGAPVGSTRGKMAHTIPMGSLDNTDDGILGVGSWLDMIERATGSRPPIYASLKIDGASVCANYKNGKLDSVLTRGNGEIGEVITANALKFLNLPKQLAEPLTLSVRGEAILYKKDFVQICEQEQIPVEERSNPRNVGNGILGRDDGRNSDRIRVLAFNVEGPDAKPEFWDNSEELKFKWIEQLGFEVAPGLHCADTEGFNAYYNKVLNHRESYDFEIDGIVICVDDYQLQQQFVTSDKKSRLRPKYARAVKFPHKSNTTKLIGVNLSVGHTGLIAPTAILETVRVGGVNVTNVLLNNWDEIKRLDIQIGDDVEVVLAGDIIPKIIRKVSESPARRPIEEPKVCPACGSKASRNLRGKDGANTYCTNLNCKEKQIGKIDHWIGTSKKGVGILGIGDAILRALFDAQMVKDPADLYTLEARQIADLELDGVKIGVSRAKTIVDNIQSSKNLTLATFLGALGIDLLGSRRVLILQNAAGGRLDSLDSWLDTDLLDTISLPGMGDAIRDAIIAGIEDNRSLIQKLIGVGVTILGIDKAEPVMTDIIDHSGAKSLIAGKTFCFTGTRQYIPEVEALGGIIKSGVSKGLDYLVQADPLSRSNKTKKAEEYGTQVISVEYLAQLLAGKE